MLQFNIFVIAIIFLAISISDIKNRIIPDSLLLLMLIYGVFISTNIITSIIGLLVVGLPYFLVGLIFNDDEMSFIGGGDIKLMFVCGFLLGYKYGTVQSVIGLSLAVIYILIIKLIKKEKEVTIALAPFLSVGFIVAYFIAIIFS